MITGLTLTNFRNFESFSIQDIPSTLIVLGPNGVGKTNILESIALTNTQRIRRMTDVIRWDEKQALAEIHFSNTDARVLRYQITENNIVFTVDGRKMPALKARRYIPSVFFSPQSVSLFSGSPGIRRKLLDYVLTMVYPEYAYALSTYHSVLRQKNAALKKGFGNQISVWNDTLAEQGAIILLSRNWLIHKIDSLLNLNSTSKYICSPRSIGEEFPESDALDAVILQSKDTIAEILREKWRNLREKELTVGFTLMGPQRDDWSIEVNYDFNHYNGFVDVGRFASRGQQRLAVIYIQLAVLELISGFTEHKPIWLLDDVLSELDDNHQDLVIEASQDYQVIISATNEHYSGIQKLQTDNESKVVVLNGEFKV